MRSYATPSERLIAFSYHLCNCLHCRWGDDHWDRDTMSKLVMVAQLHLFFSLALLFLSERSFTTTLCVGATPRPADTLTSCRQLFGVDDFGSILLSCTQFDTSAHHWKGSPIKRRKKEKKNNQCIVIQWKTKQQNKRCIYLIEFA